ncbi:transmembrane protein 177 [Anticarsia gemmatalis]|uniref:transmembrane protein 177 n=1 Tax=Anticarsia gemmatalis TaxID=129554 RepID=UPI003F75785B
MSLRRPVSWFLTETGRRFSFAVVTSAGLACTVARYAPNTFFLQNYKDFVHYYNNGKPAELPKEIQDRFSRCLDLLNIAAVQRKLVAPFSVFGYDLFHAGSINTRFGVVIGVPVNFTYKNLDDLEKDGIMVNQKKVDWTSEVGKKLADALILPEKVQEFAICREIMMTQNNKIILDSSYPFASLFMAYTFSTALNRRLNLYAAPTMLRGVLYTIVGMFSAGTYFLLKDMTEVHYETETDKKLCELGPEFVESGKIFYEKLLSRNQALRELMGSEGERKYSKLGNENFGIRQPQLALVHRKQYFEDKLKELNGAQTDSSLEKPNATE